MTLHSSKGKLPFTMISCPTCFPKVKKIFNDNKLLANGTYAKKIIILVYTHNYCIEYVHVHSDVYGGRGTPATSHVHTRANVFIHMPALVLPTLENNIEMTESSSESEFKADFSEEEFTDCDDQHINEAGHIVPYMCEPEAESDDSDNGGEIVDQKI